MRGVGGTPRDFRVHHESLQTASNQGTLRSAALTKQQAMTPSKWLEPDQDDKRHRHGKKTACEQTPGAKYCKQTPDKPMK